MSNYITSTCSADMTFPMYVQNGPKSMSATSRRDVVIRGRANVTDKYSLQTPTGAVTEVTNEELEFLQNNIGFKKMVERGFLKVTTTDRLDRNLTGMEAKDRSAQLQDSEHAKYSETLAYYGPGDRHSFTGEKPALFRE